MASRSQATSSRHWVDSKNGVKLSVKERLAPDGNGTGDQIRQARPVVVLVHQYSLLGGSQALMQGLATELNSYGLSCVTFDMRGVGKSSGHATLTGQSEVSDVASVCRWAAQKYEKQIVLVGSSAGAPIAGSAVDLVDEVEAYVGIGYTFGFWSSILFGGHYKAILASTKPKFFIMGSTDGFTSVKTFEEKMGQSGGRTKWELVPDVGHFELEGPDFDMFLAKKVAEFIEEVVMLRDGGPRESNPMEVTPQPP